MSDDKLRSAIIYRIDESHDSPVVTMLAKYDYASTYGAHIGAATEQSSHGGGGNDFADVMGMVVTNDPPKTRTASVPATIGGFKVMESDHHKLVYAADPEGLCIAIITGLGYPSRVATQLIIDLYNDYVREIGIQYKSATAGSLTKKSKPILANICKKYSDVNSVDKTSALMVKVDEVKVQMHENIASMLRNIEKSDDIESQASQLNEQATVFKKKSTDLRRHMRCKNIKMIVFLLTLVICILAVILIPLIIKSKNVKK